MRKGLWTAAVAIALAAAALGGPADAAGIRSSGDEMSAQRAQRAQPRRRAPARITVWRRSFLDIGTEVLPGERKFTDYAVPPGYSATSVIDGVGGYHRYPLPGPFDLPSRNNPWLNW